MKYKLGVAIIVKSLVLSNLWYLLCDGDDNDDDDGGGDDDDDDDRSCDCHTHNSRNSTFWYHSHAMSHARNNGFDTAKTIRNVSQLMFVEFLAGKTSQAHHKELLQGVVWALVFDATFSLLFHYL